MKSALAVFAIAALAAAGCHKDAPVIDAAHLPAELRGLVPGAADEAAVIAALPGAVKTADTSFGGATKVELDGEPAIAYVQQTPRLAVWLVKLDGATRVAMIRTKVADACTSALATLGDRVAQGTCASTNRKFDHDEHELCAKTPDGKHDIDIECVGNNGELSMWVKLNDSGTRSTLGASD